MICLHDLLRFLKVDVGWGGVGGARGCNAKDVSPRLPKVNCGETDRSRCTDTSFATAYSNHMLWCLRPVKIGGDFATLATLYAFICHFDDR